MATGTPASQGFAMPAEWTGTRPPGWPGRTTSATGRASSRPSPGSTARSSATWPAGRRCGCWWRTPPTRRRCAPCSAGSAPRSTRCSSTASPPTGSGAATPAPSGWCAAAPAPPAPSPASGSTPGPSTRTGRRTSAPRRAPPRACSVPLLPVDRGGRQVVLEAGPSTSTPGHHPHHRGVPARPAVQVRNPGYTRQDYQQVFADVLGPEHHLAGARHRRRRHPRPRRRPGPLRGRADHRALPRAQRRRPEPRPAGGEPRAAGGARLEDGSRPALVFLPMPAPLVLDGQRLPASYANFYVANAAVLVPTFNDPNDRVALGSWASCSATGR